MQTAGNFNRDDETSKPNSPQDSNVAENSIDHSSRKMLPERIVIALLLIICCFALASNLLR